VRRSDPPLIHALADIIIIEEITLLSHIDDRKPKNGGNEYEK
jgi:hypothetical protein